MSEPSRDAARGVGPLARAVGNRGTNAKTWPRRGPLAPGHRVPGGRPKQLPIWKRWPGKLQRTYQDLVGDADHNPEADAARSNATAGGVRG